MTIIELQEYLKQHFSEIKLAANNEANNEAKAVVNMVDVWNSTPKNKAVMANLILRIEEYKNIATIKEEPIIHSKEKEKRHEFNKDVNDMTNNEAMPTIKLPTPTPKGLDITSLF